MWEFGQKFACRECRVDVEGLIGGCKFAFVQQDLAKAIVKRFSVWRLQAGFSRFLSVILLFCC